MRVRVRGPFKPAYYDAHIGPPGCCLVGWLARNV